MAQAYRKGHANWLRDGGAGRRALPRADGVRRRWRCGRGQGEATPMHGGGGARGGGAEELICWCAPRIRPASRAYSGWLRRQAGVGESGWHLAAAPRPGGRLATAEEAALAVFASADRNASGAEAPVAPRRQRRRCAAEQGDAPATTTTRNTSSRPRPSATTTTTVLHAVGLLRRRRCCATASDAALLDGRWVCAQLVEARLLHPRPRGRVSFRR